MPSEGKALLTHCHRCSRLWQMRHRAAEEVRRLDEVLAGLEKKAREI
jgi:hypothetical protein